MSHTRDWSRYMREAITLAGAPDVEPGGNPRVGCVIVDAQGAVVGGGYHRGAGSPHAEVVALADAGDAASGATAVVTLEPCRHTGRTGPCTLALIEAGVTRVVYAVDDAGDESSGGAQVLRDAGIEVIHGVEADDARWLVRAWFHSLELGRPWVTLKSAVSLDGRVADVTGGPTPITGSPARAQAHEWRSRVDAIIVGTGTVLADDPSLTARASTGEVLDRQPLRVVVGRRSIDPAARVLSADAPTLHLTTRDPREVLARLHERDVQHVLLEGGPTLAAAFFEAGVVDEILWFIAPVLLGEGPISLPPLRQGIDVDVRRVQVVGEDVVVEAVVKGGGDVHRHR